MDRPSLENSPSIKDLVERIAAKSKLPETQVRAVLQAQAEVTYDLARTRKPTPLPGIGVLTVEDRPASTMTLAFGPDKGRTIKAPARATPAFRLATHLREMIRKPKMKVPDVLNEDPYDRFTPDGDDE